MKSFLSYLLSVVFLIFSGFSSVYPFVVTGRILVDKDINDSFVVYFKNDENVFKTTVDKTGFFKLNLDKGTYLVTAEAVIDGKVYKGFSGRNPLYLDKDEHIGIKLFPVNNLIVKKTKSDSPIINGRLLFNKKPVKDGRVYLYMNWTDFKGMPYYYSLPTDKKGQFKIRDVVEGNYFVVARKKSDGNPLGPLAEGDLIGFLSDTPYNFKAGYSYKFDINLFKKMRDEPPSVVAEDNVLYITGKVVDKEGNPVEGLYAFAYEKKVIGHERPVSISKRTNKEGTFILPLPKQGRYYLGVREFYGGTPVQGEYYGLYSETFDHHIDVDRNINNVTITVEKILK